MTPSATYHFPAGFLWGAATAAHQVEGSNTTNNWSDWENQPGRIKNGDKAGLAAFWAGEFSNSYVLAKMKILTRGRWLWTRTIGSTLVGELVDSAIFIAIASLFGVFPWSLFLTLVLTNYVFKCTMEAVMTPVTYRVVAFLKRTEQEDYYDYHTDFNPFKA